MHLSRFFHLFVIVGVISILLSSCAAERSATTSVALQMPPTSQVIITFDEKQIPGQCRVFSQLIISIPAGTTELEIKNRVEQFAIANGADYLLVGMTRESAVEPENIMFRTYGPASPYSFKTRWAGWKFGFSDWNSGGPLVDYGQDRMSSDKAAFDLDVDAQAILLTCQLGPNKP